VFIVLQLSREKKTSLHPRIEQVKTAGVDFHGRQKHVKRQAQKIKSLSLACVYGYMGRRTGVKQYFFPLIPSSSSSSTSASTEAATEDTVVYFSGRHGTKAGFQGTAASYQMSA
jgi:hypothetical protein